MTRLVSFIVLATIVAICGALFFRVMAGFLVPVFLAVVLVVMFRPLYRYFLRRTNGRIRIASLLTTIAILLIFLTPIVYVSIRATVEGWAIVQSDPVSRILDLSDVLRDRFDLQLPPQSVQDELANVELALLPLRTLDRQLASDRQPLTDDATAKVDPVNPSPSADQEPNATPPDIDTDASLPPQGVPEQPESVADDSQPPSDPNTLPDDVATDAPQAVGELAQETRDRVAQADDAARQLQSATQSLTAEVQLWLEADPGTVLDHITNTSRALDDLVDGTNALTQTDPLDPNFSNQLTVVANNATALRTSLLGDPMWYWLRVQANPSEEQVERLTDLAQEWFAPAALSTTQWLAGLAVTIGVMTISLYYFFADGPGMIESVINLVPLDNHYQLQILEEFDKLSRAVVVATVLSAFVQGCLASIAYWILGLASVFLLAALTMVFSLVPFVGAAAVWGTCCVYLAFVEDRQLAAIFLAVYGVAVISMADNVIKPMVLHGQSNIHPLLALLSVLGGVQALGPIGIFVGPMVVAFLQVVLRMLHTELTALTADAEAKANTSNKSA